MKDPVMQKLKSLEQRVDNILKLLQAAHIKSMARFGQDYPSALRQWSEVSVFKNRVRKFLHSMKNTYTLSDCDRNGTERKLIFHYDFDEYVSMGKVSLMFKGLFRDDVRRCISKEVMEEVREALDEKHYEEESNREFNAWCDKVDDSKYN